MGTRLGLFVGALLGGIIAFTTFQAIGGCTAEQQAAFDPIVNPDHDGDGQGALDDFVNTPLPQLGQAAETYVSEVATGLAAFTIAGIIGLFTPKPGTKKKLAMAEEDGRHKGFVDGHGKGFKDGFDEAKANSAS